MTTLKTHLIIYIIYVASILFDLATTILCFQIPGLTETNPIYQIVGFWAFPIVYIIDAGILLTVEWLRKQSRYVPIMLFIPTFFNIRAAITNLLL